LDTVVFIDPKAIDFFTKDVLLAKIDAEKDTVSAQALHVSGYPTLVLLDNKGEEIDRIAGYLPTDELIRTITDYRAGIGTLADLLNKAKDSKDRGLYMQIGEKFKYRGIDTSAEKWYMKVVAAGDPLDSISGQSRMEIADMYRRNKSYDKAIGAFAAIAKDFTGRPTATDADWYIGDVYRRMKDTTSAIKSYEAWLMKYPTADTEMVAYTKKVIEKLKQPPAPKKTEG
jgi:tetratricopeptide (TPR) repeat protein